MVETLTMHQAILLKAETTVFPWILTPGLERECKRGRERNCKGMKGRSGQANGNEGRSCHIVGSGGLCERVAALRE